MSYGVDGFAFATESLVGKYKGANEDQQLKKAIRYSFIWAFVLALFYSVLYGFASTPLFYLFTQQEIVIQAAQPYLGWVIVFPIIAFACYIWDGIYIGLTASIAMRNSMLLSFVLFLIAYFATKDSFGNHGLWLSLLIFLAMRGLFQTILYLQKGKNLK